MEKTRFFLDVEKEARWLNAMSQKGYRLIDKWAWCYEFMSCEEGAYCYAVEPRNGVKGEENKQYRAFLQELGIELVTKSWGKYYFEKEADGKAFEIYTDHASKIKLYIRQFPLFFLIAIINMSIIYSHWIEPSGPWILGLSISYLMNITMLVAVSITSIKYAIKITYLKYQIHKETYGKI